MNVEQTTKLQLSNFDIGMKKKIEQIAMKEAELKFLKQRNKILEEINKERTQRLQDAKSILIELQDGVFEEKRQLCSRVREFTDKYGLLMLLKHTENFTVRQKQWLPLHEGMHTDMDKEMRQLESFLTGVKSDFSAADSDLALSRLRLASAQEQHIHILRNSAHENKFHKLEGMMADRNIELTVEQLKEQIKKIKTELEVERKLRKTAERRAQEEERLKDNVLQQLELRKVDKSEEVGSQFHQEIHEIEELHENTELLPVMSTPMEIEVCYQKTKGFSNMGGELYEVKVIGLLHGRALKKTWSFSLASNMAAAGSFDDIMMKVEQQTMFLQLKHRMKTDKKLTMQQLVQLKGDFSLVKYCKSYKNMKEEWSHNKDLQMCGSFEKSIFIIYTSVIMDEAVTRSINTTDWQDFLLSGGICFQFTKKSHPRIYKLFESVPRIKELLTKVTINEHLIDQQELLSFIKELWNKPELTTLPPKEELVLKLKELESIGDLSCYKEFLSQLWLFTGQASENNLDALVKQEIESVLGTDKIYPQYLAKIQNWWRVSKTFLTEKEQFWQDIIHSCIANISRSKFKQLTKLSITFHKDVLDQLRTQLLSSHEGLHIVTKSTSLSCLKVIQSIAEKQCLLIDGITLHNHRSEVLALWDRWCDLLVVVEDGDTPTDFFYSNLGKRLVYISEPSANNAVANIYSTFQDNVSWRQLDEASQNLMLNKKVAFQGQNIFLKDITKNEEYLNDSIHFDILVQLLMDNLVIGDTMLSDVDYYIPQMLQYQHAIMKEIFRTVKPHICFAVSGSNKSELQKLVPLDREIYTFMKFKSLGGNCVMIAGEDEFHQLQHFHKTVHWLNSEDGVYMWKQSRGDMSLLQEYLQSNIFQLEVDSALKYSEQVMIVSADPGMGKSTLITHLAQWIKQVNPAIWVVRVDLIDFTQQLNKLPENFELQHAIEFLVEVSRISADLQHLFRCKLSSMENVCVLFDGFDEVSPTYSDKVILMCRHLQRTKLQKLWITTRPVMKKKLEWELSTLSFTLQTFPETDQRNFLMKLWESKYPYADNSLIDNFITELLQLTARNLKDRHEQFTGIPLQSMLLAEAFETNLERYIKTGKITLPQKFDLPELYKIFVERKLEIYFEKNKLDITKSGLKEDYAVVRLQIKKNHMISALITMLSAQDLMLLDNLKSIRSEFEIFVRKFQSGKEKLGIVKEIINDKPVFIHRTFSEYFTALWFVQNYNSIKDSLKEKLYDENFQIVRNFFDRILSQKLELHIAVMNQNKYKVETLLSTQKLEVNAKDEGGRTALHIAIMNMIDTRGDDVSRNVSEEILKILLEHGADPSITDEILHWRPLRLAERIQAWSTVELLLKKKVDNSDLVLTRQNIAKDVYLQEILRVVTKQGLEQLLTFMLNCGMDVNYRIEVRQGNKIPLIHAAYDHEQFELVKFLIKMGSDIDQLNSKGFSLLQEVCRQERWEDVQRLFEMGADINKCDEFGNTALHKAARRGELGFMENLIKVGCDVNILGENGNTALHEAAYVGHILLVRFLTSHEADLQKINNDGDYVLHCAAITGDINLVTHLLKFDLNIDCQNYRGQTPLLQAAQNGKLNVVKLLLARGSNLSLCDKFGNSALHYAAWSGNVELVMCLLDSHTSIDCLNQEEQTPLMKAAENGKLQAVKLLLERKADIMLCDKYGNDAQNYAVRSSNVELVVFLLTRSTNGNASLNPLLRAAREGNLNIVKFLTNHNSDLMVYDEEGNNALHLAASSRNVELVSYLLDKGLSVHSRNNEDETPIMKAAESGMLKVVQLLLERKSDVNALDKYGNNVLHSAAWSGSVKLVKYLLENELECDCLNNRQETPLWWAVRAGWPLVVRLLNEKGASLEVQNVETGFTPLHEAARCGNVNVVECLVQLGANVNAHDKFGRTPLHVAVQFEHIEVEKFLRDIST